MFVIDFLSSLVLLNSFPSQVYESQANWVRRELAMFPITIHVLDPWVGMLIVVEGQRGYVEDRTALVPAVQEGRLVGGCCFPIHSSGSFQMMATPVLVNASCYNFCPVLPKNGYNYNLSY